MNGLKRPAQVAEPVRAAGDDVAQLSDRVVENRAVIRRVGLGELRPLVGLAGPIELAAVDDHAADARAVAADELRGAINRDVDAVVERPQQDRRQHRIVANDRQAVLVGHVGNRLEIQNVVLGVGHRLDVNGPRVRLHGPGDALRIGGVDEGDLDPQPLEGLGEERDRAAVEGRRRK